jgi:hypothetical protein
VRLCITFCLVNAVLLAALVLAGVGAAEPAAEAQELVFPLRGPAAKLPGWELVGPDAAKCVKFEEDGLRITLPTGFKGERPGTGVRIPLPGHSDFDVTIRYEVLSEPATDRIGALPTKFLFQAQLDRRDWSVATVVRRVSTDKGMQFTSWTIRDNHENTKKRQMKARQHPATTKVGRLRVARSGSEASFFAAEGAGADLVPLLPPRHLGDEKLKCIELLASTGAPTASMDIRLTDLRVRGVPEKREALEKREASADVVAPPSRRHSLALPLTVLFALGAGVWLVLYLRHRATRRSLLDVAHHGEG